MEEMLKLQIYEYLKKVPKGKVITYKELAKSVNSKAYRFVGHCMKTNSNRIKIPCYKVIKSDGKIGEYSDGGIEGKIAKLRKEGIEVVNGKVDLKKYGWKFQ
ncbi:MAG: MGMT family protein [Thermoplasmata archaeon]